MPNIKIGDSTLTNVNTVTFTDADDSSKTVSYANGGTKPNLGTIAISTTWNGSGPYTQTITVTGATVTANSMVDIQLTPAQIEQAVSDKVNALTIQNNNGVLTLYAIGNPLSVAMTVQVCVTEVEA